MKRRIVKAALICLPLLPAAGCSYFRWNEPSYQEMHDRVEQQKAAEEGTFKHSNPEETR